MALPLLLGLVAVDGFLRKKNRALKQDLDGINAKTNAIVKQAKMIQNTAYGNLERRYKQFNTYKKEHCFYAITSFRLAMEPIRHMPQTDIPADELPSIVHEGAFVACNSNYHGDPHIAITIATALLVPLPIIGAFDVMNCSINNRKLSDQKDIATDSQKQALIELEKAKTRAAMWQDSAAKLDEAIAVLTRLCTDLRCATAAIKEAAAMYDNDYRLFPHDTRMLAMTAFNIAAGIVKIMHKTALNESGVVPLDFVKLVSEKKQISTQP